jgi:hypothetical protein
MINNSIFEISAVYEMWKNVVERGRPQMTIWRMRVACWVTKSTNTDTVSTFHTHCISTTTVVTRMSLMLRYVTLRYTDTCQGHTRVLSLLSRATLL